MNSSICPVEVDVQRLHVLRVQEVEQDEDDERQREQDALAELRLRRQHAGTRRASRIRSRITNASRSIISARLPPLWTWITIDVANSLKSGLGHVGGRGAHGLVEAGAQALVLADLREDPPDRRGDLLGDQPERAGQRVAGPQRARGQLHRIDELRSNFVARRRDALREHDPEDLQRDQRGGEADPRALG